MRPLLDVDWSDEFSWMTHRIAAQKQKDASTARPSQASSIAVGKMLKSVLGWDEERVEEAKKNGANRREGVNNAARHGATSVELDRQGGWTNSHSSSRTEKPNVRDQHYMDVQSNIGAMLCSAGYKRDELPTAAGRSLSR